MVTLTHRNNNNNNSRPFLSSSSSTHMKHSYIAKTAPFSLYTPILILYLLSFIQVSYAFPSIGSLPFSLPNLFSSTGKRSPNPNVLSFKGEYSAHHFLAPDLPFFTINSNEQNNSSPAFYLTFKKSNSDTNNKDKKKKFKRDEADFDARQKAYSNIPAFSREGIYLNAYLGSNKQHMSFMFDTTVEMLVANIRNDSFIVNGPNVNKTLLSSFGGFEQNNSTSYNSLQQSFNIETIEGVKIEGTSFIDDAAFGSPESLFGKYTMLLAEKNSMVVGNIYSLAGMRQSVSEGELSLLSSSRSSNLPVNIAGLGPPVTENSFLSQLVALGYSSSPLFSLAIDSDLNADVLIGAIDTSRFEGQLHMQPILTSRYYQETSGSVRNYPFITLTGIELTNYNMNQTINYSTTELALPVLMDISSPISFLPYSIVVYLAARIGAYYSTDLKGWIQDCSYRQVNGTIGFSFYNVTINVPLPNILIPIVNKNGDRLYFESGEQACALAFLPAEAKGFSSLGTSFFEAGYTVFDYTNMLVGLANAIPGKRDDFPINKIYRVTRSVNEVVSASTFYPNSPSPMAIIMPASPSFTIPENESYGTLSGLLTSVSSTPSATGTESTSDSSASSTNVPMVSLRNTLIPSNTPYAENPTFTGLFSSSPLPLQPPMLRIMTIFLILTILPMIGLCFF